MGKAKQPVREFHGKTVDRIEEWVHGTYDYVGYVFHFTDGTYLRLRGNSNADIEMYPGTGDPYKKET